MSENAQISTKSGDPGHANLVYILYLASLVLGGIPTLVGVIMAYLAKDGSSDVALSHYRNQIHVFWKGIVYAILGAVLSVVIVGFVVWLVTAVWYVWRVVKGMQLLSRGEIYPNPESWGV